MFTETSAREKNKETSWGLAVPSSTPLEAEAGTGAGLSLADELRSSGVSSFNKF